MFFENKKQASEKYFASFNSESPLTSDPIDTPTATPVEYTAEPS